MKIEKLSPLERKKKAHYCDMANILSEQTKFTTDE